MKILVTGSNGLVGSETCTYFSNNNYEVYGIDNNMRKEFFGIQGDTTWNLERLKKNLSNFVHYDIDIRNYSGLESIFTEIQFDAVIHCAAQPSHDKASQIPLIDFSVNANGTLNLLELYRQYSPDGVFVYLSTNKVYGDSPNELPLIEKEKRFEYKLKEHFNGIDENCRIDRCLHSIFGASKLAGDILVQEYGKYFKLATMVLRGGCLTGPHHSGVELHGFLSYLVKTAVYGIPYVIYGYKGKQVRDNIHSNDIVKLIDIMIQDPMSGEVFNLGGGRDNSVSILEAIEMIEGISGRKINYSYVDENRIGDHKCYITNLSKLKNRYPQWNVNIGIEDVLKEMVDFTEYEFAKTK